MHKGDSYPLIVATYDQERVYPHTKTFLHLNTSILEERVYPCTLGSLLLTGKKECTPTLKCSCILIYTGKKECTPTLFSTSITREMTFVYPGTILTPSFPSITGRKPLHSFLPVNTGRHIPTPRSDHLTN